LLRDAVNNREIWMQYVWKLDGEVSTVISVNTRHYPQQNAEKTEWKL
jgi:hypothetical protein